MKQYNQIIDKKYKDLYICTKRNLSIPIQNKKVKEKEHKLFKEKLKGVLGIGSKRL